MTRRPQNIKRIYDTVFFDWELDDGSAQYILGGYVIGFPDPSTAMIRITTLYSIVFPQGEVIYSRINVGVSPDRMAIPITRLKHINDVRFLK